MPKVRFEGRIIPERAAVSMSVLRSPWRHNETGIEATFEIRIENSKVSIECDSNKCDTQDEQHILIQVAFDSARTIVDLAAFKNGERLYLTFDTVTLEDGNPLPFRTTDPQLAAKATALSSNDDFKFLLDLATNDMTVFMALRNLNEAMEPRCAQVKAAHAMDGLRSYFVPSGAKDFFAGWAPLREALNVSEPYLKTITDQSKAPRHGDYVPSPGINRTDVVFRAWEIMNRFLEYKKRKSGKLPLSEFPLLN
jgi:hypothetical protein